VKWWQSHCCEAALWNVLSEFHWASISQGKLTKWLLSRLTPGALSRFGVIQKAKKTTAFSSLDHLFSPDLRKQVTFPKPEITPPFGRRDLGLG